MLTGRSFVAHLVFLVDAREPGNLTIIRNDFRATVVKTALATGTYDITLTDDCATDDAVVHLSSSPEGGVAGGKFVGLQWERTAADAIRIYTQPANIQLDAGPPAVFGFDAGGAADAADGTIISFSLDRVDTV